MIYLDTSLVIPLCVLERNSDKIEAVLTTIDEPFCISEWTRVEFTSALGIKVRTRELTEALARRALADYYRAFEPGVTVFIPTRDDYIRAADYLQDFTSGLRGGDALHLAVATNSNPRVSRVLTLDMGFIKSARGMTVSVELPW